uniref:Uncharacterized protein n=1 Tax=Poecilia mexicana TaxID=48701 RepID=A0A3B3Y1R9_9TELE
MASDHQGSFLRSIMAVSNQREQRGRSSRGERNLKPLKNEFLKSNTVKKNVLNVSQTVQIMVGVFNVGLGPERVETFPYWLGVPFMAAGVLSLLADRFPLRWLTGFSVFLNIAGSILSIVAIVLYAVHLASFTVIGMCGVLDETNSKNCIFLANLAQKLLRGVDITMIVMSALQLCVCISLAVLGNKAFYYRRKV